MTEYTRRVRRSINRGMKGEYSSETTVEVTYTGDADAKHDAAAAVIGATLMAVADRDNRSEIDRRKALDAEAAG